MDEDVEENYREVHPDLENDLRFFEARRRERTEEENEYELDFEEDLDEYEEDHYEIEGEGEEEEGKGEEEKRKGEEGDFEIKEKTEPRRLSIYDLASYASSTVAPTDTLKSDELAELDVITEKTARYSTSLGVSGIARLNLSPLTQKIIGCVIGENVTTEYPWIYVKKELIEDNIDLHDESSDFLQIKDEIESFPDTKILMGYAPSTTYEDQFYICLTEAGREAVIRQIEIQRLEQELRVRNAVFKTTGQWQDLGSAAEIDDTIVKNNRPLCEIEIESTANLLNKRVNLVDRDVDDQRDGYVKLIPYRETFNNVKRSLINAANQAGSTFKNNETQTIRPFIINTWSQHLYEYTPIDISNFNDVKSEIFKKFLEKYRDSICNELVLNATWDLYTNDYANLMHSEKDSRPLMTLAYKEHQNYYDGNVCMDKVINDLSWHPLWTGIAACAYTDYAKSTKFTGPKLYNEVKKASEGKYKTLLWSFNDCLSPKLILESSREVCVVSVCPLNGNVIVGGCSNGQIVIWHIPGMVEEVEAIVVQTTAQIKYRIAMKNLMTWMRDSLGASNVEVTAMSSLQHSQKGRITQIEWVPTYSKVGKNGRITSLPEDTDPQDVSSQFITACEDGTIAFWDLKWEPLIRNVKQSNQRRDKGKVPRPDVLLQSISPYKELDGLIQPDYILLVEYPENNRRVTITSMNIFHPKLPVEQVNPFPPKGSDVSLRRYYKTIYKKPADEMLPKIFIGTVEGFCGYITWEGFDFSTGQLVNRELCKWIWINMVHDGPVTHAVRSEFIPNLLVTIGGRVIALWTEDFHRPFFWNKARYRYTSCSWTNYRASTLVAGRSDGTIEVWNFAAKSIEPSFTQSFSGGIITGIYNHQLPLHPPVVAFCDFNGALRVFLAPLKVDNYEENTQWMQNYINREVKGMLEFEVFEKEWLEANKESIEEQQKLSKLENERRIKEEKEKQKAEMEEKAKKNLATQTREPMDFIKAARIRWTSMELKRMQHVILEKKGLKKEELERRRAPILKMKKEAEEKKRKLKTIMRLQDKIFEDTAAFLLPKQYYEQQRKVSSSPVPEEEKLESSRQEVQTSQKIQFSTPEEEIIYNFMEVQAEALSMMRRYPLKYAFHWRHTLSESMARRNIMDVELRKFNKFKKKARENDNLLDIISSGNFPTTSYSSDDEGSNHDVDDTPSESPQSEVHP